MARLKKKVRTRRAARPGRKVVSTVSLSEQEQNERILLEDEVYALTRLHRSTRWLMENRVGPDGRPEFPRRVRLVGRRVGWRWSELREWLQARERGGLPTGPSPREEVRGAGAE